MPKEVGCGGKCSGSFAWYDPDTSLWRTWQRCLTGGLMKFSGRWPKAGMMQNGRSYVLVTSDCPTEENESTLLPTPVVYDSTPGGPNNHYQGLGQMAKKGLLPTPRAYEGGVFYDKDGKPKASGLKGMATHGMLPMPCGRDYRSPNKNGNFEDQLPNAIGGKLHPQFVEWMMSFPIGWTDLEHSETP